jgi:hypothetical protein
MPAQRGGRAPGTGAAGAPTGTVLGAFGSRRAAERAVDDLLAAGFRADEISVLGRHQSELAAPGAENGTADDAVTGAAIGAAIGGFGSFAVGLVAAAVPGIGPVAALGPFATALSAALGTGFVGGLLGFFAGHGVPEHEAGRYAERVEAGAYVVAVHTHDGPQAESTLTMSGADAPIRYAPPA